MPEVLQWRMAGDWFDVCKCRIGPGQIATWGRATSNRADAFGFKWEWDGRSSKHFPFDWQGP